MDGETGRVVLWTGRGDRQERGEWRAGERDGAVTNRCISRPAARSVGQQLSVGAGGPSHQPLQMAVLMRHDIIERRPPPVRTHIKQRSVNS